MQLHGNDPSRRMTSRRRRWLGAWLLAGWTMFWLLSAIQPCGGNAAVLGENAGLNAAAQLPGSVTYTASLHDAALSGGGSCQSLSVAANSVPDLSGPVTYRSDVPHSAALTAPVLPPRHTGAVVAHAPADLPPSGAPLYLRLGRLLT